MEDVKLETSKVPTLGCDYNFCYVCGSAMQKTNIEEIGEWWKCPECQALDQVIPTSSNATASI